MAGTLGVCYIQCGADLANNDIQEEKEKEMLPEENTSEDHVGLTIEGDEDVNQSEVSSSSGSPEEI